MIVNGSSRGLLCEYSISSGFPHYAVGGGFLKLIYAQE